MGHYIINEFIRNICEHSLLLGGYYYFTCDEVKIQEDKLYLIEGKHGKNKYPNIADIKDGLLKMALYVNLKEVYYENKKYIPIPVLKLTTEAASSSLPNYYNNLLIEASENNFEVRIEKVK